MAGDKKRKEKKTKKKKRPRKKLTVGLLKCSKSCLHTLVDGAQGQGVRFLEVVMFYPLNLSSLLKNMVWTTVFS